MRWKLAVVVLCLWASSDSHASAPAGRFEIGSGNLSGTVYDNVTKLTWQRDLPANPCPASGGSVCSSSDAATYCGNLTLGGQSGWHLPTLKELVSIVDVSVSAPAIDQTYFPSTPSLGFWTASQYAPSAGNAWIVRFQDGSAYYNLVDDFSQVRCVR